MRGRVLSERGERSENREAEQVLRAFLLPFSSKTSVGLLRIHVQRHFERWKLLHSSAHVDSEVTKCSATASAT